MATDSKFDLCSAALVAIGAHRIATFEDGTAEATVAGSLYEMLVDHELGRHRWNFAKRVFKLNRLAEVPLHRWAYLYQLPADCILLRSVYFSGQPVAYEQYDGRRVASDALDPIAEFTGRIAEDQWPAYFMALMRMRLEAHFLGALMKDPAQKERMLAEQDSPPRGFYHKARTLDAQEQPPSKFPKGALFSARGR